MREIQILKDGEFVDFASERLTDEIPWHELKHFESMSTSSMTLWNACKAVLEASVEIPRPEVQIPLFLAYVMSPSAMCTRLPVVFLYGPSGSGKSLAGIFASKLYGELPLQESTTTAGIRNELNSRKYSEHPHDPDIKIEQNTILVWDDLRPVRINPDSQDNIFGLLKSGCSRSTSITKTAIIGGNTVEYCTFGGKIISSISPIWSTPGCEELQRRSMMFQFKRSEGDREFIPLENVDITDLVLRLKATWLQQVNRLEWKGNKKAFLKAKFPLDETFKSMCCDILATLQLLSGYSRQETLDLLEQYQLTVRSQLMETSLTDEIVKMFIEGKRKELDTINNKFVEQGMSEFCESKLSISSSEILLFLKSRINDGSLDISRLDNSTIHRIMNKHGFKSKASKSGLVWIENRS